MIHFDKHTLEDWKKRNITHVSVYFYESGCAGTKIKVEEGKVGLTQHSIEQGAITFHFREDEFHLIDGGRITHAGSKWLFTSDTVNTRCGCGSSFSLKSDNPLQDKIARMKLAIKQRKEGVHR